MTVSDSVAGHYGRPGLGHEILAALKTSQATVDVDGLAPLDEFHSAGRQATAALTAQLDLQPGSHVLDVGSGIGGTARFIASTYGCRVTGIDLTEEYVETARALTDRVGLTDRVTFRQASALKLPFPAAGFDAVCMLHVGMNIEDKDTLCAPSSLGCSGREAPAASMTSCAAARGRSAIRFRGRVHRPSASWRIRLPTEAA